MIGFWKVRFKQRHISGVLWDCWCVFSQDKRYVVSYGWIWSGIIHSDFEIVYKSHQQSPRALTMLKRGTYSEAPALNSSPHMCSQRLLSVWNSEEWDQISSTCLLAHMHTQSRAGVSVTPPDRCYVSEVAGDGGFTNIPAIGLLMQWSIFRGFGGLTPLLGFVKRVFWAPTISLDSHQNIRLHTGARVNVVLLTYLRLINTQLHKLGTVPMKFQSVQKKNITLTPLVASQMRTMSYQHIESVHCSNTNCNNVPRQILDDSRKKRLEFS